MANPTKNWCHPTNDLKMLQDIVDDLTIGSAVKGTNGTLYSNFDSLRTNAYTAFMDTTYNPSKIMPTQTQHFRGYPKPTVTATFTEVDDYGTVCNGDSGNQWLKCVYSIPNMVGFDIICYASNEEDLPSPPTYTTTIPAGSTSATDLVLFTATSGTTSITYTMVVSTDIPSYSTILVGAVGSLLYIAPAAQSSITGVETHIGGGIDGSTCGCGGNNDGITMWYDGTGSITGKTMYTLQCGSTTVANNWYMYNQAGNNYWFFQTINGVVTNLTYCSTWDGLPC